MLADPSAAFTKVGMLNVLPMLFLTEDGWPRLTGLCTVKLCTKPSTHTPSSNYVTSPKTKIASF